MLRQTFPGSTLLAMTTALLVIDAQQGLCKGEHQAFESARVISRINRVYAAACARH
jgi:nicotinamidase-related amidase